MSDDHVEHPGPHEGDLSPEAAPAEVVGEAESVPEEAFEPRAGLAWQFPLIAVSAAAIAAAILFHRPETLPPDHAAELSLAGQAIDRGDLDAAAGHLGLVESGLATHPELLASYHLAVADHRAAALRPLLTSPPAQAVQVVEAYRRAEQDGAELDVPRRRALAEALVATGRDAEASRILEALVPALDAIGRDDIRTLRHDLRRREIDRRLLAGASADSVSAEVASLLAENTSLEIEAWATALDARLRLETGDVDGLARGLGLAMHRLEGRSADAPWESIDWPTLWVLLGHAYRDELGATERAVECYGIALDRLKAIGDVAAEASLALGDIRVEEARDLEVEDGVLAAGSAMATAATRFDAVLGMADSNLDQKVRARIGLATLDLLRGDHDGALDVFDRIAALLEGSSLVSEPVRSRAVEVAMAGSGAGGAAAVDAAQQGRVKRCTPLCWQR